MVTTKATFLDNISRRKFLGASLLVGAYGVMGCPGLAMANVATNKRLMVVILRGAMDGLAAVPPVGDGNYRAIRGKLALTDQMLLPLDSHFAMHASLKPIYDLYQSKQMVILHAAATPYRERSHFDAQDLLENGSTQPHGLTTGWLGRTVEAMGGTTTGLSVGPTVPLVIQGTRHITSWAPSSLKGVDEDFMGRIQKMYEVDPILGPALGENMGTGMGGGKGQGDPFIGMMKTAGTFMAKADGPRIATIDLGGWDTHSNQDARLNKALGVLAEGIKAYKDAMGPAWNDTAVLVITEFGRTAAPNGTGGSDHGTASASFLLGGGVNGGRVIGDFPGLAQNQLYQGRDVYPVNDLRGLIKGVLVSHMGVPEGVIDDKIMPQSTNAAPIKGLFTA